MGKQKNMLVEVFSIFFFQIWDQMIMGALEAGADPYNASLLLI